MKRDAAPWTYLPLLALLAAPTPAVAETAGFLGAGVPSSPPLGAGRRPAPQRADSTSVATETRGPANHTASQHAATPCQCSVGAPLERKVRTLEFSFGSAQKFFDQSVYDPGGIVRSRTIPVTTVSVLGEWLFHPRFSIAALFDLPLEPRSTLVEGQLTQTYVPPSISGGVRASAVSFDILEESHLDWQFFVLLGSTLAGISGDTVFPTVASRFHLRDDEGFTLYAGASFEFRLARAALVYGVGHRF